MLRFHIISAVLLGLAGGALIVPVGCVTRELPAPVSQSIQRLPAPEDAAERTYLGLPAGVTNFALPEIECELLVVDFFDMYCHICQREAKHINDLYDEAQRRQLSARIKFVGVGVGN